MLHHIENHIENMRQRPDHKKKQYALFVSGGITLVIFGFWMATHTLGVDPAAEVMAKTKPPVAALTANVGDAFGYVKSLIFGKNKTEYSSDNIEVVGGKN